MIAPSRIVLAAAIALGAASCSGDPALGPPRPESMSPGTGYAGSTIQATIAGRGFYLDPNVSYLDEDHSEVASRFIAYLGTAELAAVTRVDSRTLEVTVPATLPVGVYDLTVVDPQGREGSLAAAFEVVTAPCLVVTTGADEANAGESAEPPHLGAGLSLREAIVLSNERTGEVCIEFAAPMTIALGTAALPAFTGTAAVDVDGGGGVVLDGAAVLTSGSGLDFTAPNARITGMHIANFDDLPGIALRIAADSVIEDCDLTDSRVGAWVSGARSRVTGNRITEHISAGVRVRGEDAVISDNWIADAGLYGVDVGAGGDRTAIHRNVFLRDVAGVSMDSAADVDIDHNTFFDGSVGVAALTNVTGARLRNSIIAQMSLQAIFGDDNELVEVDYLQFFGNGGGQPCSGCTPGPNCANGNPQFADDANDDFSLSAGSPAIDSGVDTGLDVNGAAAGLFNGVAPDRGALESP